MRKEVAIKEGQLCTFKGATVRVIKPTNNNMWLVGTHGQLWGSTYVLCTVDTQAKARVILHQETGETTLGAIKHAL